MRETVRRRPLWLTVPLYAAMLAVLALDGWATVFWWRVGGSLGWAVVATLCVVMLLLALVLGFDARRQWLLSGPQEGRPVE